MFGNAALWHYVVLASAGALLLAAALRDARHFRIPNSISLALLLLFPVHVLLSPAPVAWAQHTIVFIVFFAAGYFLYAKKFAGAGDVKLLSVASLWAGPGLVGLLLFITAVSGGVLALATAAVVALRSRPKKSAKSALAKTPIPYGVAIALGGLCTLIMIFQPALLS